MPSKTQADQAFAVHERVDATTPTHNFHYTYDIDNDRPLRSHIFQPDNIRAKCLLRWRYTGHGRADTYFLLDSRFA